MATSEGKEHIMLQTPSFERVWSMMSEESKQRNDLSGTNWVFLCLDVNTPQMYKCPMAAVGPCLF